MLILIIIIINISNKLHQLLYHRDRTWKIEFCKSEPEYFGSGEGYVNDPEESDVAVKN